MAGATLADERDDHQRLTLGGAHEVADQIPARLVGPLDVVEHHDYRALAAEPDETLAERGDQAEVVAGRRPAPRREGARRAARFDDELFGQGHPAARLGRLPQVGQLTALEAATRIHARQAQRDP